MHFCSVRQISSMVALKGSQYLQYIVNNMTQYYKNSTPSLKIIVCISNLFSFTSLQKQQMLLHQIPMLDWNV